MKMRTIFLSAAATVGGFVVISTAFAQTWTQTSAPITNWTAVASSADGSKLVAVTGYFIGIGGVPPGPIYTSHDSGVTWKATSAPSTNWSAVASSADGTKLIAAANGINCAGEYGGLIYT